MLTTGSLCGLVLVVLATLCGRVEMQEGYVPCGYRVIFRIQKETGNPSFDVFMDEGRDDDSDDVNIRCKDDFEPFVKPPCTQHYRSGRLDDWGSATTVRVGIYKDFKEVKFFEFDAAETNFTSWFSKPKIKSSSYTDLSKDAEINILSIKGHADEFRRFFINNVYNNCPGDKGWLLVVDKYDPRNKACTYEITSPYTKEKYPRIMYSTSDEAVFWNDDSSTGYADFVLISIK